MTPPLVSTGRCGQVKEHIDYIGIIGDVQMNDELELMVWKTKIETMDRFIKDLENELIKYGEEDFSFDVEGLIPIKNKIDALKMRKAVLEKN